MKKHAFLWLLAPLLLCGAVIPHDALETLRRLPVQHFGRVKPFDSFARETLDRLSGNSTWRGQDPVETVYSIFAEPDRWQEEPLLAVPYGPLREALGLGRKTTHVSYSELMSTKRLMRMLPGIVQKQEESRKLTMLENETMELYDRFVTFHGLLKQEVRMVPPPPGEPVWGDVLSSAEARPAWEKLIESLRQPQTPGLEAAVRDLVGSLYSENPGSVPARWRLDLELLYNRLAPFKLARALYLLAALLLLVPVKRFRAKPALAGWTLFWAAFLLHLGGVTARVVLGGRPPVSNFYETMLWLPLVAVLLAAVFERIYRSGLFAFSAALLSAILLLLADHLPLDSSISPVVAVLRSNLWLSIHVLMVVGSYAPIALATVLAHLYGAYYLIDGERHPMLPKVGTFMYRSIQVGVVMLAAGIMLGAVWANASWGRYWGWDPKETWSLITLLWFIALLHGRFAGWLKGPGMALGTVAGFFLLLMTYYGVSFYLVGLHSYAGGNAKPFPPLLIAYILGELLFMAAVARKKVQ